MVFGPIGPSGPSGISGPSGPSSTAPVVKTGTQKLEQQMENLSIGEAFRNLLKPPKAKVKKGK